ncbi:MAG TPA: molybdenum cofactor biosynthesis protein MoaE [Nitrososphaeraceae archaeon]|nr:molybdenum cofactor biosynthesis protein MoaE [Nitrososphaeraceae archaeon]HEX5573352.1 molybdenum cofactor biosynthesis protein MoaE [Nitrososphaeraceae archaeon]HEX5978373.1 molybdenum cofactor biosynthesis protein MoaE [Nitrososphaeraceae archaeon]
MISITNNQLSLQEVMLELEDNSAGALSVFIGNVRNRGRSGNVSEIYYEAYSEMAEQEMREIENEAQTKWGIKKLVAIHRIGNIKVGESSIIIGVSSEHRHEAFEACKYVINNVKTRVPIWKKEISRESQKWADGILLE